MTQTILSHLSDQEATELARLCRVALSGHELDGDFMPPVLLTALRNVRDWCAADLTARREQFTNTATSPKG